MKVELELWHLFLIFFAFVSAVWAGGRVLLDQFEKRLDERFVVQERHRLEREAVHETQRRVDADAHNDRFGHLDAGLRSVERELGNGQRALERDLLLFKSQLPDSYVRRDDYIRGQTVIEAKLDALAAGQSELRTLVAAHD